MAGTTVKGINIEVGGETTSFNRSMKQVNSELRATSKNAKSLDSALKLNPDSVELLTEKTTLLSKQMSLSQKKTSQLNSELKRLESKSVEELTTDSIRLTQELNESKNNTAQLNSELKRMQSTNAPDEEIAKLKSEINASKSATQQLNAELKQTNADIKKIESGGLDNLKADIRNTETQTAKLNQELIKTENQLKDINSNKVEISVNEAINDLNKLNQQIDEVESNLKKIENEDITIETIQAQKQLEDLKRVSKEVESAIREVDGDTINIDTKSAVNSINKLNEETKTTDTSMKELESSTKELTSGLAELGSSGATEVMTEFSSAMGPVGEQVGGATQNIISMGASMAKLGPIGIAAGAGIGALTSGLTYFITETKNANAAALSYEMALGDVEYSSQELDATTDMLAKGLGIEYSEAAQIAAASTKLYGTTLQDTKDQQEQSLKMYTTMTATGYDATEMTYGLTTAQELWNLTASETEAVQGHMIKLTQEHGKASEDLIDTMTEFGPMFASLGVTEQEFFQIMNAGLEAGARNTDEVANAANEMNLRFQASVGVTDEFDSALATLGMTQEDLAKSFQEGGLTQAYSDLNTAAWEYVNSAEYANDITEVGAQLMGTYGEEVWADGVAMGKLTGEMNNATGAQNFLNQASATGIEWLEKNREVLGLSEVQYSNLVASLENLTVAQLLNAGGIRDQLLPQMQALVEQGVITQQQYDNIANSTNLLNNAMLAQVEAGVISQEQYASLQAVHSAYKLALDAENMSLLLTSTNTQALTNFLMLNYEQLGLTKEQTDQYVQSLTNSSLAADILNMNTTELTAGLTKQVETLFGVDLATKNFTVSTGALGNRTKEVTWAEAGHIEKLQILSNSLGINETQTKELVAQYMLLTDAESTNAQKASSLSAITDILSNSQVGNTNAVKNLEKSTTAYSDVQSGASKIIGDGIGKQDDYTFSVEDGANTLDDATQSQLDHNKALERQYSKSQNNISANEQTAESSAKVKKELDNATSSINTYNATPIASKEASVTINERTVSSSSGGGSSNNRSLQSDLNYNRSLNQTRSTLTSRASTPTITPTASSINIPVNINLSNVTNAKQIANKVQKEVFEALRYSITEYM